MAGMVREKRVLMRLIATHARKIAEGEQFHAGLYMLYPEEEKLVVFDSPFMVENWLTGREPLEEELNQMTQAVMSTHSARGISRYLRAGFTGGVLIINSMHFPSCGEALGGEGTYNGRHMLVGTLAMLTGEHLAAVYSVADSVTEFTDDDEEYPWDPAPLLQLLFTLEDMQKQLSPPDSHHAGCDHQAGILMDDTDRVKVPLPDAALAVRPRPQAIL